MVEFCIACNKKITDYNWKNYGEGWICSRHFKSSTLEFVPQRIKEERKKFSKSLLQPFRNGELSKEYLDSYGTKHIQVTEKEVRRAKNVWSDILPTNWESTK